MLYNQWHIKIHVLFPSSLKKDWSDFFQYFLILELYQTDKKKIYILTDTYNAKFGTLLKEKNAILSVIQLVYTVMQNTLKLATY